MKLVFAPTELDITPALLFLRRSVIISWRRIIKRFVTKRSQVGHGICVFLTLPDELYCPLRWKHHCTTYCISVLNTAFTPG
jgi:hypothetical protein